MGAACIATPVFLIPFFRRALLSRYLLPGEAVIGALPLCIGTAKARLRKRASRSIWKDNWDMGGAGPKGLENRRQA